MATTAVNCSVVAIVVPETAATTWTAFPDGHVPIPCPVLGVETIVVSVVAAFFFHHFVAAVFLFQCTYTFVNTDSTNPFARSLRVLLSLFCCNARFHGTIAKTTTKHDRKNTV